MKLYKKLRMLKELTNRNDFDINDTQTDITVELIYVEMD